MQVKEPDLAMLARGKVVYEPPRYMTVNQVRNSTEVHIASRNLQP